MDSKIHSNKSFWKRPEGFVGGLVMFLAMVGAGYLVFSFFPLLLSLAQNILWLSFFLLVIAAVLYLILDPKMRTFIWYMYQNIMRWFTGLFIQIDPIGILKNYIDELRGNLSKMYRQIGKLRGQMHLLMEQIHLNKKDIDSNLSLVNEAQEKDDRSAVILKSRKAGRLRESNIKLEELYRKMEILYRVLNKMYENSQLLVEDVEDQVELKEKERKIIHAGHSAMQSAMNMISGNTDQRILFDRALDAVADDVASKVGEMEQFMELSENFMASIDLQKGIFEEKGLAMLEKWEKQGDSLLLGEDKESFIKEKQTDPKELKLPEKMDSAARKNRPDNQYDAFFD
nr:hypothetical protein [Saprospiraceae bacterium]